MAASPGPQLRALHPRLRAVADYVRFGVRICDVGTDHGYLICALTAEGKIPGGLACDIRPGPLSGARGEIARLGLSERIETRLCDGLSGVSPAEAEDIVIAGMGGELIAEIVGRADWLKNPQKQLVLQPQTRAPQLRRALFSLGFSILQERGVREGRFLYTVLCCRYGGAPKNPSELFCHTGMLPQDKHPESREYLLHLAGQLQKRARGLLSSRAGKEQGARCARLSAQILELVEEKRPVFFSGVPLSDRE